MSSLPPEQLYESDFYAWTQVQAKELRRLARVRPNLPLDLAHIAEEIRDLGKSERTQCSGAADHRTLSADRALAGERSTPALGG